MSRGKRVATPLIQVQLLREGIPESVHQVTATVSDVRGRNMLLAGEPDVTAFARSALKPFQALPMVAGGTLERFELSDKDLAIACGSHLGTVEHARQVFSILWRADIEPTALQCPIPEGKHSALQYNCSGKHAAMLAMCQQHHWPLNTYLRKSSQVQGTILNRIAELLKLPGAELIAAKDDCGAPTYSMQLSQLAWLYAQLASGENLELERIVRAMVHYPQMVAGPGHFDTELMLATEGALVSKSGSEGIQCVARVGYGLGLAIKVLDGAKRAKYATAIHLLRQMGWISPTVAETLGDRFLQLAPHRRLEVTGELAII
ncbi:MAG: asparaginase [Cyanobacteria bacterium P01_H01_bin.15]